MADQYYLNKAKYQWKVGLLTVIGLLILIAGYAWLRDSFTMNKYSTLQIRFPHAAGIEKGDAVTIRGVNSGRITDIKVIKDGVIITVQVKIDIPLTEGTTFQIHDSDLMGGKELEILPGESNTPLPSQAIYEGSSGASLAALVSKLTESMSGVDTTLNLLNRDNGILPTLQTTIANANQAVTGSEKDIRETLQQFRKSAAELHSLMEENRPYLRSTLSAAPAAMEKLSQSMDQINKVTAELNQVAGSLNNGQGTISKLIQDKELYDSLKNSATSLDSLISDVKKNPKRYFQIRVF